MEQRSCWRTADDVEIDQIRHQETARMVLKRFEAELLFGILNYEAAIDFKLAA
jgi:hypothetical protein